jgi:DNA-binding NarL/FixJ family response regulator
MQKRTIDGISLLDDLYALALSPGIDWAPSLFELVRPHIDAGLGALAYEFDLRVHGYWISPADRMIGDPEVAQKVRAAFDCVGVHMRASLRPGPVLTINKMLGMPIDESPLFSSFARSAGAHDYMGVLAVDSDGRGLMVSAPLPRDSLLAPARRRQWSMLARHLTAATRLQRAIARTGLSPCGRIDATNGRADVASDDAPHASALCASAKRIFEARRRREEGRDERALSMWQVLSSGNWSLVSRASEASRAYLAYENPPKAPDPRRLSHQERVVAHLAGFGHANKLIAYELGCKESTVSNSLTRIRRKLGLRSRAELVSFVTELASTPARELDVGTMRLAIGERSGTRETHDPRLTAAEHEVARLAARGLSNAAIASIRSTSPRTIANQLARIYDKLEVSSRAELAATVSRVAAS